MLCGCLVREMPPDYRRPRKISSGRSNRRIRLTMGSTCESLSSRAEILPSSRANSDPPPFLAESSRPPSLANLSCSLSSSRWSWRKRVLISCIRSSERALLAARRKLTKNSQPKGPDISSISQSKTSSCRSSNMIKPNDAGVKCHAWQSTYGSDAVEFGVRYVFTMSLKGAMNRELAVGC